MKRRTLISTLSLAPFALAHRVGSAQSFGDKPIRVVVPFAPGNTLDTALRQVAEIFKQNTGQAIVIEAKPGGSGIIAAQTVMQAPPDGYTLLLSNSGMFAINPHTFSKLPYDPYKSFKPVTTFAGSAMVMAVHSSVPANNIAEFVAWAKANPGRVSFASSTAGSASHFAGVLLNKRAGIDMAHVPFNGTPQAAQNLAGGQINAAFLPLLSVKPNVESGKVKMLAITSPQRSPLAPQLATFREQGYPDLDIYIWAGLSAPAGTPAPVITKLNTEFGKVLRMTEIRDKLQAMGFDPLPSTPEEFTRFVQAESKRWAEAVKISGFKATE